MKPTREEVRRLLADYAVLRQVLVNMHQACVEQIEQVDHEAVRLHEMWRDLEDDEEILRS